MRHEIIPTIGYADALKAIDFLCRAFGFERHGVYLNGDDPGIVDHAQLVWADRMVMLSSARENASPREGTPPVGLYLVVADVDGHAARAAAAGAEIIMAPRDQDYGGRGYSARDTEGNWSFGSYDPWADA